MSSLLRLHGCLSELRSGGRTNCTGLQGGLVIDTLDRCCVLYSIARPTSSNESQMSPHEAEVRL